MKLGTIVLFLVCGKVCIFGTEAVNPSCVSPQYFQIGTRATVNCMFQENFTNLFWYDPTDPFHDNAVVVVQNSVKQGRGFLSGEFDINADGSLIINNVTLEHEGTFTALLLQTLESDAVRFDVQVFVFGPFLSRLPHIEDCIDNNDLCFQTWNRQSEVLCVIQDARPAVPLSWMVRTYLEDQNVTYNFSFTNETNSFFTSRVTTRQPFTYSPFLALLVCKADAPPGLLLMNESLVLLLNKEETLPNIEPVKIYAEIRSKLKLNCSRNTIVHLVWHVRKFSEPAFKNVGVAFLVNMFKSHIVDYNLSDAGSLMISNVTAQHEGVYRCISSNGFEDDVVIYEVFVFSSPHPRYLVVDGCDAGQDCTLEVHPEGNLTCSVKRIRPRLRLDFRPLNDKASTFILFYDKNTTVKDNEDTFDISLTSKYSVNDNTKTRIPIECALIGSDMKIFNLSTKLELRITKDKTSTDETSNEPSQGGRYYWIAFVVILVLVVLLLLSGGVILKGISLLRQQRTEENNPMVPLSKERDFMIDQLKRRYEDLYHALQPVPGLRGKPCCVNEVFVENGMQYLDTKEKNGGQANSWKKLDSYSRILDDLQEYALRCIVEGEPGYGKSTLALQLAYDWCNDITDISEKETRLLILLRLRQLSKRSSIYSAIKESLLPLDTQLSETDIESILRENERSVLVVMDGFDEYPHQNSDNDIISIIARKKCQSFKVILTTRTSHLPKKFPLLTRRIRLTGFDKHARNQYIQKVVPGCDAKAVDRIQRHLKDTPLLKDLCQVPLFFAMFVHLIYENEEFLRFQSVTSFFRSVMACLHNHMKGKMNGEASGTYVILDEDQCKLEELAFQGLNNENQQISWMKEELYERLGQDFYNQYKRTGILVEEHVLDIVSIQYRTIVRFYHDIFCEWFAAQYLAKYPLKVNPVDLRYLDPFKFQYVYRFACGLNVEATKIIIPYLEDNYEASIFTILCFLEISGMFELTLQFVEILCATTLRVEREHSRLFQRSVKELVEVASAKQIAVTRLWLYDCYSKVELGTERVQLKSEIEIPVLATLQELWIQETGGEYIRDEVTDILQYSLMCEKLMELHFYDCLLPYSVQTEHLSTLNTRKIEVIWQPRGFLEVEYHLNFVSGTWESTVNDAVIAMTHEDHEREVKEFKIRYRHQETNDSSRVMEENEIVEADESRL